MKKVTAINELMKAVFSSAKNFIIFPFGIVALLFSGLYYAILPFYMLTDYLAVEYKRTVLVGEETPPVQVVKHLLGYFFYVLLSCLVLTLSLPLVMGYFVISVCIFISSLGKVKVNPFKFHE